MLTLLVSWSPYERTVDVNNLISEVPNEEFKFKPMSLVQNFNPISYFFSQVRGEDGIPKSVIVNSLSVIGNSLVKIMMSP